MAHELPFTTSKGLAVIVRGMGIPPPLEEPHELTELQVLLEGNENAVASIRLQGRSHHLWVMDLQVTPGLRRKGIASLLLSECLKTGKNAGYTHLYAVAYSDADRGLYKAMNGIGESNAGGFEIYSWGL